MTRSTDRAKTTPVGITPSAPYYAPIEGIYQDGRITLLEPMPMVSRARLAIMVLPETGNSEDSEITTKNRHLRRMSTEERTVFLVELRERWRDRLSSSDEFARYKEAEVLLEERHPGASVP